MSLAAIAADERRKEISIDSGAEVWHLKAGNLKDFVEWTRALENASSTARGDDLNPTPSPERLGVATTGLQNSGSNQDEEREWEQVEALVSRIVGTRDAVRRLSKDTAPGAKRQSHIRLGLGMPHGLPNLEEHAEHLGSVPEKAILETKVECAAIYTSNPWTRHFVTSCSASSSNSYDNFC